MDLKKLLENKLVLAAVAAGAVFLFLNLATPKIIDALSNKVIEKLHRDYVPGPYNPGLDPDKVPPNLQQPQGNPVPDQLRSHFVGDAGSWLQQWEMGR